MRVRTSLLLGLAILPMSIGAKTVPAKRAAHRVDWTRIVSATPEGGMRMGNPNAPVKLVEYGSRTCPHCAKFNAEGMPPLKTKYIASGHVSYEFRDFPVHGAIDLAPILLGRCVSPQQFFPVLERMFAQQDALLSAATAASNAIPPNSSPNDVARTFAERLGYFDLMRRSGFPAAKLAGCLADRSAIDRVASETGAAEKLNQVNSTPTFLVNGKAVANAFTWGSLEPSLRLASK